MERISIMRLRFHPTGLVFSASRLDIDHSHKHKKIRIPALMFPLGQSLLHSLQSSHNYPLYLCPFVPSILYLNFCSMCQNKQIICLTICKRLTDKSLLLIHRFFTIALYSRHAFCHFVTTA